MNGNEHIEHPLRTDAIWLDTR